MKSWRDLTTDKIEQADVIVASVSSDRACSVGRGSRYAPRRLRKLSWSLPAFTAEGMSLNNLQLFDAGDIGKQHTAYEKIALRAGNLFAHEKFNLFLGGDHAVSIPLQAAFFEYCRKQNKIPAIIHIDAHPDFCDVYDGSKYSHACTNYRAVETGYRFEDIIVLGARGFEEQEIALFAKHPELTVIKAATILKEGWESIANLKLRFDDRYAIYLSFDIDAIDPSFCPGTGTPETFGLSPGELTKIVNYLVWNLPVRAMDIVEVSPPLDINNITSWTALKILYEVFALLLKKNTLNRANKE